MTPIKPISTYLFRMAAISWAGALCLAILAVVCLFQQSPKLTIALVCATVWMAFSGSVYGTEHRLQIRRESSRRPRIHL